MIPMDDTQKNHLKAYGIAYWVLQQNVEVDWLLNYRGEAFFQTLSRTRKRMYYTRCFFEIIANSQSTQLLNEIAHPEVNQDVVKLEKAPKLQSILPKVNNLGMMP